MAADPKTVQELFAQAIAIDDRTARQQFVEDRCQENAELYARVVKLLSAYEGSDRLLESPTNAFAATMMASKNSHQPGHVIAERYKLLESIGEGGMGTVWVAEQTQPVRRKVALKLVKPGMDSKQVLARFDAERQALALMDHPNIAKVFDGGVTEYGRPFFAMEYVKGMPLTEYCDQMRLPVDERLRLFVPICQAVQHAHQKGIIHRDLKPSNVLICLYDGKPVPKVIDFGLAKAMYQPLTEQTVHTGHGLMIGTPLYMSPEQAEHNNLDVDTRTDIYSLGVMLYELLTGSTPLEKAQFKNAAFGEILRIIKEVEPPKPSTRIGSSINLPTIAAQRNLDSKQLGRSIRGDLDWIVMKAIEKERGRRYDTANGLARDIERFLNLEAVEACPPSTSYRLRRLARKHRTLLGTAAAFAMMLILGAGLSLWQALRATKAESLASQRLVDVQIEQQKTQEALEASQQSERRAMDLEFQATSRSKDLQLLSEEQRRIIYASEMIQVRLEAQRGNLARMREILLDQLPIDGKEDLRGFEWNYWYRYINQANILRKYDKAVVDTRGSALVSVLPGGRQVAWTQGKTTELVDLDAGTSRQLPFSLRHYVERTPTSENGRFVVGACLSHTYPLGTYRPPGWDQGSSTSCSVVEPTGQVHKFEYPKDSFKHISALNISRDGKQIAVIGYDVSHSPETAATRICVWNVDAKQLVLNKVYHREINRISFSPDGKTLAVHLCHGTQRTKDVFREVAVIIDIDSGGELAVLENDDDIDSLFWVPGSDRILLATLGFNGASRKQLISWQTNKSRARPELLSREPMPDYIHGTVSPDGSMLAITSHTVQHVRLFDSNRGEIVNTLHTDGQGVVSIAFSSDGRQLTATTVGGELIRWELGKDRDLFGLRTNPLPRLAKSGFALSPDQSLMSVVLIDGTVLVRTRDGLETKLKVGIPKAAVTQTHARISPNNELLAVVTDVGPDGKTLPKGKGVLEVYDLIEKKRLWQTARQIQTSQSSIFGGSTMEFSADGKNLVQLADACYVSDARTGKGTAFDPRENRAEIAALMMMRMQRDPQTGSLFVLFAERTSDKRNRTVVFDPLSGAERYRSADVHRFVSGLAPNGKLCVSPHPAGVEVCNIATGEQLLTAPGLIGFFSWDSQRLAIVTPTPRSATRSFSGIAIWDLASRQKLCDIPLTAEVIEDVRFSPDGRRLLTLEGKTLSSKSTIPRGRLWDVETGREILDMPVAEVNHYEWELFFDTSGQQLTQLLFNKTTATIGGGKTAFYDARPLDPAVDNNLAAERLIEKLTRRFAIKKELVAEIESLSGLKAGIRDAALRKIQEMPVSADRIAMPLGAIVGYRDRSMPEYERALAWAEELQRIEPNSHRSRSLIGAAYYRLNRLEDALKVLSAEGTAEASPISDTEASYDKLRRVVLALVQFKMGRKQEAEKSLREGPKTVAAVREHFALSLSIEAQLLMPTERRILPAAPEKMLGLKQTVQSLLDKFGEPDVDFAKLPANSGYRLVKYDINQDQRLNQEEMTEAIRDILRFGFPIAEADWQSSVEPNLEFLDETIRDAPHYMTPRFVRAWIRATCADPQFRDSDQAMQDAESICEQSKYHDATFLELLAAAHASSNDFASALRWQTEAVRIHAEKGPVSSIRCLEEARVRLKAYEHHKLCDGKLPRTNDLFLFGTRESPIPQERDISPPYLSPQVVLNARRIIGSRAAWSPDGTKLIRRSRSDGAQSILESIDLATEETRTVCDDGTEAVWGSTLGDRIYFVRLASGTALYPFNASVWYCDSDGKNLTRLMEGSAPALLQDGTLVVRTTQTDQNTVRSMFRGFRLDANGALNETGLLHEMEGVFGELSPDGKLAAESASNLVIREIGSKHVIHTVDLESRGLGNSVVGAWSPDSRFYIYCSKSKSNPGLWVLDVSSGDTRLLADLDVQSVSWSPDGLFLAASERGKDTIVILDVSSLHRESNLVKASQK